MATTSRWTPVAAILVATAGLIGVLCLPAGVRLDDRAAGITLLLFGIAPLALAGLTWVKDGSFRPRDLLVAGGFGLGALAGGPFAVVGTALCVLASVALLRTRQVAFPWLHWLQTRTLGSGLRRALITAAVVLAALLLLSGGAREPSVGLDEALLGLSSATVGEAGWRLFLYSVAIYLMGGVPRTKLQRAWCLALLVVPQVLIYTLARVAAGAWGGLLIEGGLVAAAYALPLALVFRRHGVLPALLCHAVIDTVRFAALA